MFELLWVGVCLFLVFLVGSSRETVQIFPHFSLSGKTINPKSLHKIHLLHQLETSHQDIRKLVAIALPPSSLTYSSIIDNESI